MVIEYIGQLIRNEVAEMREKIYEKQVITDLQLASVFLHALHLWQTVVFMQSRGLINCGKAGDFGSVLGMLTH